MGMVSPQIKEVHLSLSLHSFFQKDWKLRFEGLSNIIIVIANTSCSLLSYFVCKMFPHQINLVDDQKAIGPASQQEMENGVEEKTMQELQLVITRCNFC